jgi:hypothetical protein
MLHVLPDFTEARCVIGLDAYPTEPKWRANTSCNLNFDRILTEKEEQQWRRNERDLEIVQIGSNKNTWTTSGFNEEKVTGVCSELRHRYGEEFNSGITSKQFVNVLQDRMKMVGVKDPVTTHYGLEKSVEKFEDEMVGLVAGCISPSSDSIKDWLAMLEKDATPKREIQDNYDGQEWVGTDAAIAHDLIADVREKHVLQSIGRFARSPSDPNDGATVYVMTNILPNQWVDTRVDGVDPLRGKQCEIASVLYETTDGVTPAEIDERVDCSTRHVYKTLRRFEEAPWCCIYETEGNNDGDKYHATRDADCIVNLSEI